MCSYLIQDNICTDNDKMCRNRPLLSSFTTPLSERFISWFEIKFSQDSYFSLQIERNPLIDLFQW